MAKRIGLDATYAIGEEFRNQCLCGKASLLWPGSNPWSAQTVENLWSLFAENPDEGSRTFLAKLKDQLRSATEDSVAVAADILAFYLLYPDRYTVDAKVDLLETVLSWRTWEVEPSVDRIRTAFEEGGIGYPGTFYNTGRPYHFAYLIELSRLALADPTVLSDRKKATQIADRALAGVDRNVSMMRNISLHLMYPEYFERVATNSHKELIARRFREYSTTEKPLDEQLADIRIKLETKAGRPIDFYDEDIWSLWRAQPRPTAIQTITDQESPRVWIEKTIVANRADRNAGDYAVGSALWSPTHARDGSDTYRFMRDLAPGDYVLHLTDNKSITGISQVSEEAKDFIGIENTDWANRPSYLVRLTNYEILDPPLSREVFLQPPYREQLLGLLSSGLRHTFYGRDGNLNQGAYITPVAPQLLGILNSAYRSVADRDLVVIGLEPQHPVDRGRSPEEEPGALKDLQAVQASFATALKKANLSFGGRHEQLTRTFISSLATKPFVILTGLSGSGKTQLALQFGHWCGEGRYRVVPVRPDWTGAEALFGYEDALLAESKGRKPWHVPAPLEFMLRAAKDPYNPYVLILDEMNLAHVERYFADVLSGMESAAACLPNLTLEDGYWFREPSVPEIPVPRNLFLVGTVNVDETTYMFSPKVLDRANTIEFRVETAELAGDLKRPGKAAAGASDLVKGFLLIATDDDFHSTNPHPGLTSFREALVELHKILSRGGFEFGHRVFYETSRFASMYFAAGTESWQEALDMQILQKVLPKLHGSRRKLEPVLIELGRFCSHVGTSSSLDNSLDPFDESYAGVVLTRSFDKIRRLAKTVRANQFASFTE